MPTRLTYVLSARGLMYLSVAETTTLVLAEPLAAGAATVAGLRPVPLGSPA